MIHVKCIKLNERDYRILATLYLLKVSSASQLRNLYFPSESTTRKCLLDLCKLQYVSIERLETKHSRRWINVYLITQKGAHHARNWLERRYNRVLPRLKKRKLNNKLFRHELLMVDVFVELVKENVLGVEDLFTGKFVDSRLSPVLPNIFKTRVTLKADARFVIEEVNYWLEVDRGTEKTSMLKQKILRYQTYFASNPTEQNRVIFMIDGNVDSRRVNEIKTLSCEYIGPHNNGGKIQWYTLPFTDLKIVIKHLVRVSFFEDCIRNLIEIGRYKNSIGSKDEIFNPDFLPTANMAAAWLGFKDLEGDYEQWYIVESVIGGESGALHRLSYFTIQMSEFYRLNEGRQIKLIVLISDPQELTLIDTLYPGLRKYLTSVSVPELLSGQSKVLIGREENN